MVFDHLLDNRGQSFMLLVLFLLKKTLFYVVGRLGVVVLKKMCNNNSHKAGCGVSNYFPSVREGYYAGIVNVFLLS
jgi:hypothetical protein